MNPKTKPLRNPWPAAIITYFVLFFSFTVAIVGYISHQKMDLVRGDYYDDEIRYQEQLDRMKRTKEVKDQVAIAYDQPRGTINIALPPGRTGQKVEGRIRLYRPSDESLDRDIRLELNPAGCQTVDAKGLRNGLWKVRVYWSANGRDYFFGQSVVVGPVKS